MKFIVSSAVLLSAIPGAFSAEAYYDQQCASSNFVVDIDGCRTIGSNLASKIAKQTCNYSGGESFSWPTTSKLGNMQDCLNIARDDCQGTMDQKMHDYCFSDYRNDDYELLVKMKDPDIMSSSDVSSSSSMQGNSYISENSQAG
eukprot:scaffold23183_cov81-Skeletonema_dohrnii-CCMP3373.AAC.4